MCVPTEQNAVQYVCAICSTLSATVASTSKMTNTVRFTMPMRPCAQTPSPYPPSHAVRHKLHPHTALQFSQALCGCRGAITMVPVPVATFSTALISWRLPLYAEAILHCNAWYTQRKVALYVHQGLYVPRPCNPGVLPPPYRAVSPSMLTLCSPP